MILLRCSFSNHCPRKSWGGGQFGAVDFGAGILAALAYLSFGVYGAKIDQEINNNCNEWRREMVNIALGKPPTELVEFDLTLRKYYLVGGCLVLAAFVPIVFIFIRILP